MPPVKKRPVKRSRAVRVTPAALESMVEERAEAIVHQHNIFDLKMIVALAVIGIASMAMNVLASTTSTTSTTNGAPVAPAPASTTKLIISPKVDSLVSSRIVVPSAEPVRLAKWNLVAEGEPVKLERMIVSILNSDYSLRTQGDEFGTVYLYGNDGVTVIGQTTPLTGGNKGYIDFTKLSMVVSPGQPQSITLAATINGSGKMKPNTMIRFGLNDAITYRWQATGTNSLEKLLAKNIKLGTNTYGFSGISPLNLFHNSVPVVTVPGPKEGALTASQEARLGTYTMTNRGDQALRISKLFIQVSQSGIVNGGTVSTTGRITDFKLYLDDNGLETQIAFRNNCLTTSPVGGPQLGISPIVGLKHCNYNRTDLLFYPENDINGAMDNLVIEPGESKTFFVTGDTTQMMVNKAAGSIVVSSKITGSPSGFYETSNPKKPVWGAGTIFYHYTPKGGKENTTAYQATDSYPVMGQTFVKDI